MEILRMWKLWLAIILVVLCSGTIFYVNTLKHQIEKQRIELQASELRLKEKQTEVNSLTVALSRQNEAINKLKEETNKLENYVSSVNKKNKQLSAKLKEKINIIMTDIVPEDCPGAIINLKDFAKNLADEWNRK